MSAVLAQVGADSTPYRTRSPTPGRSVRPRRIPHRRCAVAYSYKFRLERVHSYDEWHDTAQRLSMAGQAIIDDKKTYGPCINHVPNAWQQVHASVDALNAALSRDPTSLRQQQPELYLEPITRTIQLNGEL